LVVAAMRNNPATKRFDFVTPAQILPPIGGALVVPALDHNSGR